MPKPKRRKNLFGFGRKKSSGNFIPASGGIAYHSAKRRAPKAKGGETVDSKLDDVAKSLAKGKKYASLSSSEQAMVRRVASKMNPKRAMKIYDLYWSPTGQKIATVQASTAKAAKRKAPKPYSKYKGEIYTEDRGTVSNPKRKRNLQVGLPKNQFVNAKVRLKGGKVQIMADESVLGKAGFSGSAGLRGVSVKGGAKLNPKGRYARVYERAYDRAKAADEAYQKALDKAGEYRYATHKSRATRAAKRRKIKADEAMRKALAAMRAHGESLN